MKDATKVFDKMFIEGSTMWRICNILRCINQNLRPLLLTMLELERKWTSIKYNYSDLHVHMYFQFVHAAKITEDAAKICVSGYMSKKSSKVDVWKK